MALVKGRFVDKDIPIQSNNDPVDPKDLARKGYVDQKASDEAAAAAAEKVSKAGDTMTGPLMVESEGFRAILQSNALIASQLDEEGNPIASAVVSTGGINLSDALGSTAIAPSSISLLDAEGLPALPTQDENVATKKYVDQQVAGIDLSAKADLVDGKVPSSQLPGYVDDVEEYADLGSFPVEGSAGKLYVAQDTNKVYRWSGTVYIEISASPGSTDEVAEGALNLYFTDERAQAALASALSGKADVVHTHVAADITDFDSAAEAALADELSGKSDVGHTHVAAEITDFVSAASAAAPVQSVAGKTGAVSLVKGDVGLGNVDNTSDLNKPISTATATALAGKQASLGTGTTSQYLRGDLTWQTISAQRPAKVLTVGIDANTIAGCIALATSPSATNNYVIEIPPGTYTENLTIPGNVHLKGLANPSDSLCVKIVGQHTITGASANGLNNRVSIANILFTSSHATTATFAISGSADTEVQMSGCYMESTATASTAKNVSLGLFGKLYANNVKSRMAGSGNGGTHFTIAAGGQLYTQYGLDVDGGTCVIDMTGQGYAQIVYAILACQGASAIKIAANGQVLMQASSVTNNASIGNGVNLLGANANCFATHCVFNIQDNAASYVVTGVAGSYFGMFANSYSHIPGLVIRNTKIGANVTQLRYSGSLIASDIGDFQSAARTAAVADAINDGTTNIAPSQNAVFDALALKLSLSGGTMSGALAMGSQKITGLANGSASTDAVNKGQLDAAIAAVPAGLSGKKEVFTLSATDISNGYVDCAHLAAADTMLFMSGGVVHQEVESYTLSVVGGKTRITFTGDLVAPSPNKLLAGDKVYIQYMK